MLFLKNNIFYRPNKWKIKFFYLLLNSIYVEKRGIRPILIFVKKNRKKHEKTLLGLSKKHNLREQFFYLQRAGRFKTGGALSK